MTLRVGIISANWGTFAHLPAWRSIPGVEVVAICTSRRETAEAAAKKHGIEKIAGVDHTLFAFSCQCHEACLLQH